MNLRTTGNQNKKSEGFGGVGGGSEMKKSHLGKKSKKSAISKDFCDITKVKKVKSAIS